MEDTYVMLNEVTVLLIDPPERLADDIDYHEAVTVAIYRQTDLFGYTLAHFARRSPAIEV